MIKLKKNDGKVYLRFMHLGDIITSFNILYNLATQEGIKIGISGENPEVYSKLFEIFNYNGRIYLSDYFHPWKPELNTVCFDHYLPYSYLNICFGLSTLKKMKLKKFILPDTFYSIKEKKDFLCFHFLCRSVEARKSLTNNDVRNAFGTFEKKKSICIGGTETKTYIKDREYFFSDLINLSKKLMESSGFFGIDSGMAHLAGTLKVDGDIIIQAKYDDFFNNVKNSFSYMYPTFKMHSKKSLEQKLLLLKG